MFICRKLNPQTYNIELWECEWEKVDGGSAKKVFKRFVRNEDFSDEESYEFIEENNAILWSPGRTIGNIAANSESILGSFPNDFGEDAIVPCDIIPAGKFRYGARRWYCKTHQTHWGTKADFEASRKSNDMLCGNHSRRMAYVVNPPTFSLNQFAEIGIWCSLPPALSMLPIIPRSPKIHIHARQEAKDERKVIDRDFHAVSLAYNRDLGIFENPEITKVHVTPPSAFEFVSAIENGIALDCINCSKCKYPHLDLGDFGIKPHKKHFCGNCGSDSIWSKSPIISTPLKPIHDQFSQSNTYISVEKEINMDLEMYKNLHYEIWASTPAILWTANRAQEKGIHVHVYKDGKRIVDDTFGTVIHQGRRLNRDELWASMRKNVIV